VSQAPPPNAERQNRGSEVQDRRGTAVPRIAPRVEPGRAYDRPRVYVRPYYAFRPRWSLGYGLWVGYPVAYPYYYPYPAPYPDPNYPTYPYPSDSVNVTPSAIGWLSFDITPTYADVYVDGQYVGTVADFGPTTQPLSLAPGRHYVSIRAAGFAPMVFDVDVLPGQVLPYQGSMRPE
jgi:PEGA domain-containing protein